ncbi:MAG: lysophospholipid acyltransferase family protein [Acidobacteriota bacterium]|nr:lysophospholipid acyltransferase family protein [Acidobacteriota bacterium]
MLEARKSRWFEEIYAVYNRNLFKRRFHSLSVCGLDFFRNRNHDLPLLVYANHSGWWDGLVAFEVSRAARLDSFIMMEEKQLKKLFLFRRLGAFSVVRENPRKALKSIEYAANLLKENPPPHKRTLWIFPQGEILPNDRRPLNFYHGVSRIIEKAGRVAAIPFAIRYEFLDDFKPEIFAKIAEPQLISADKNFDAKTLTARFERSLTETLDALKSDITAKAFDDYEKIV